MPHSVSEKALAIIKKMQQGELTESVIYEKIAAFAKGEENKQTLLRLAREEKAHYEIWKKYSGIEMQPQTGKVAWYTLIARVLGFTFAVKLMERGEENAQEEYLLLAQEVEESIEKALLGEYSIDDKADMRKFFMDLQQTFIDWNDKPFESDEFNSLKAELEKKIAGVSVK